jgi:hypothetical protein
MIFLFIFNKINKNVTHAKFYMNRSFSSYPLKRGPKNLILAGWEFWQGTNR